MKTCTLVALVVCALGTDSRAETLQGQLTELEFRTKSHTADFDTRLNVTLTHAAGRQLCVPAFFNGDHTYLVRFCPPLAGRWTWQSESDIEDLDGRQGTITVAPSDHSAGVGIDPQSSTRFRFQNGDAYYPIAFEADWLFALDAENPDDIPRTRTFIRHLADNGFNQVVMNVFAYDVKWPKDERLDPQYDFGSPRVFPFGGTNENPDHSTLNVAYFQRLDRVIACLQEHDIVAHLMIYVWNKRVNWPDAGSDDDNRYFDYVVRRYQAFPNLIWDISKEALGYGHTDVHYITDRIERLRTLDAYDRLITVHDYSYCRRFTDQVDFVSVQLWSSEL